LTSNASSRPPARPAAFLAVVACIAAAAVRVAYVTSPKDGFNGDEAGVGLMVRQILRGHNYVFFVHQNYGGTLEEYVQAGSYWLFRLPQNPITLRLPLIAFNVITCLLVYLCGARMLHTNYHAAVAALIYALGPWYNVAGGSIDLGFYAISQVLGVMGLYCGMRYATSIAAEARRHEVGWAAGFGLCCGLALWNSLTSAYLLIPTFIWMSPLLLRSARGLIATSRYWDGSRAIAGCPRLVRPLCPQRWPSGLKYSFTTCSENISASPRLPTYSRRLPGTNYGL
jgi:hypothetical protein